MKPKFYLSFFLVAIIFVGFSCSKDEIAPETTRTVPKATIKGKVWADLDASSNGPGLEAGPSGLKIIAQIWAPDLAEGTVRVPETYINYETTTNGSGEYTIEVDATTAGLTVTLVSDDFTYNQVQGIDPVSGLQIPPQRTIYWTDFYQIFAISGGTLIQDIVYNTSK